jgi:hypothetical protein
MGNLQAKDVEDFQRLFHLLDTVSAEPTDEQISEISGLITSLLQANGDTFLSYAVGEDLPLGTHTKLRNPCILD